jgi:hypothetical protein
VLNSGGDGLPSGVGGTAPGRDSQARQSSGAALWHQSIKCPYTRAGAGARGGVGKARVGALERRGPRPRGCSTLERGGPRSRGGAEPSSEADPARGGVRALSEADPARGGVRPSSEAELARGSVYPSSGADFTRGASAVLPWRAAGATRVAVVLCTCVRCASWFTFRVFCRF